MSQKKFLTLSFSAYIVCNCWMRDDMKEEHTKRDYFWIVEASDRNGRVNYRKEYHDKDGSAFKDYTRLKAQGTVTLQRKFKEYKIA